ncbi:EamA family transporter [Halarchaeum sp. P4]|uniref:DMT family transporter n=1 Tax=Halarchaeum sp. P4 TaxID=3421639 RepID=UPI003EC11713
MVSGIATAVVAAFVWGGYLYALKRHFSDYSGAVVAVVMNVCATAWYLPTAALYLGGFPAVPSLDPMSLLVTAGTIALAAAGFLTFMHAISDGDVSLVAPIAKVVPVFVLPIEVLLLEEVFGPLQVLGVVFATAAIYLANYEGGPLLGPFRNLASSRPVQLALLSAACYAVSDVGKRLVLQGIDFPGSIWIPVSLLGAAVVLAPIAYRDWPADGVRDDLPLFVAAAAVVVVGRVLTTFAFSVTSASVASTIINAQAVVAVVLGGILLAEDGFRMRLAAAVLAITGIALIAS